MRCPPATHDYRALGKVLFCRQCGDVQPLLLSEEYHGAPNRAKPSVEAPEQAVEDNEEPTPSLGELEYTSNLLRDAVGLTPQPRPQVDRVPRDLGQRRLFEDILSEEEEELLRESNARTVAHIPVDEGFDTSIHNEDLPPTGL